MKYIICVMIVAIGCFNAKGQSALYEIQPNDTVYGIAPFDNLTIFDIYQLNTQTDSIILKWTKVSETLPAGWDFSLCDLGTCYAGLPQNGTMYPVPPGVSGFLGWNVMPNQVPGEGILRMYVYEETHPNDGDTLTWIITTPDFNGINDVAIQTKVLIYPIPSSQSINLTSNQSITQVDLLDAKGQLMQTWWMNGTDKALNVVPHPSGLYTLRLRMTSGIIRNERVLIAR